MNQEHILKNYSLSQYTVEKLRVIKEKLKNDITQVNPLWHIIVIKKGEESNVNVKEEVASNESNEEYSDIIINTSDQFSSTQFYFTQFDKHSDKTINEERAQKSDIVECLFEELECSNGKVDLSQLEHLTEAELMKTVCDLEKRLSILGISNLCCSINNMTLDERIKYVSVFHTYLLLPKIIAIEEPSRLFLSALIECVQKFPDDIQKLIFIPLLNIDLKDTTIIDAIVNTFEPQRRTILLVEYLSNVKELKSWHLSFLHTLIPTSIDIVTRDKLIQLLFEKAVDFAKNKNFGKLVLSFIKSNIKFSNEQKLLLWEIVNINQTLFKRPMQNVLKAM